MPFTLISTAVSTALALLAVSELTVPSHQAGVLGQAGHVERSLRGAELQADQCTVVVPDTQFFADAAGLIGSSIHVGTRTDAASRVVGVIYDLVVECASRSVTHVIVSSGESTMRDTLRRLPFSDLRIARTPSGQPEVWLAVTAAQFETNAPLTQELLDNYRSETVVSRHPEVRATYLSLRPEEHMPLAGGLYLLLFVSELDGLAVRSTARVAAGSKPAGASGSIGVIDDVWIDLADGSVAYYTLQHGARRVVLPTDVCVLSLDAQQRTLFLATPCTAQQLDEAPALEARSGWTVDRESFRTSIRAYFALLPARSDDVVTAYRAVSQQ